MTAKSGTLTLIILFGLVPKELVAFIVITYCPFAVFSSILQLPLEYIDCETGLLETKVQEVGSPIALTGLLIGPLVEYTRSPSYIYGTANGPSE